MADRLEVYKCDVCGNMVELLIVGGGELVCCGEPMKLQSENTTDAAQEKHVPVIEKIDGGYKVKVGSVPHPMEDKHWIQWIELVAGDKAYMEFLNPGQAPEATFLVDAGAVTAREYCNLHGHWKASA
ncbi:MAG: desulfoferrodoxin [Desulfarculaceae bacterium]|nr:desulfoferrodoxin [Desulfarculaceae bacterium]MCF8072371.1 desulfoferrodoxin [Desulfarculaceae bacterium]MCF8100292.1 desulfoferrodoxin [Desulfarculaceae bacterium]MCF8116135.1 desulfoferrodoxin [Desulfarculaceae bacterium]